MSDQETDDTDILLAADPNGGLEMFLGLSLSELAEKQRRFMTPPVNQHTTTAPGDSESDISFTDQGKTNDLANSAMNNLELENSDFINSKGELILSGLSEWTDTDSDVESHTSNGDAQSETGSVSSFTYENPSNFTELHVDNVENISSNSKLLEIVEENVSSNADNNNQRVTSKSEELQESKYEQGSPSVPSNWSPSFSSDFNLNQNQAVDINLLRPSSGWNIPMPRFPNGDQVFTRAPNFRTPGGYKPPAHPKKSRDLSEDQILEEVLNMYAFPDFKDKEEDTSNVDLKDLSLKQNNDSPFPQTQQKSLHLPNYSSQNQKINDDLDTHSDLESRATNKINTRKVCFNFGENSENSSKSKHKEVQNGKAIKRKQQNKNENRVHNGSGDCIESLESEEGLLLDLKSTSTTKNEVPCSTKQVFKGKRASNKKKASKFSFGYGESESELSPIKGVSDCVIDSPASLPKREDSSFPSNQRASNQFSISLDDLKLVWREIETRRKLLEDQDGTQNGGLMIEDLGNVSANEEDEILIAKTKIKKATEDKLENTDKADKKASTSNDTSIEDLITDSIKDIHINEKNEEYSSPVKSRSISTSVVGCRRSHQGAYSVNHLDQNRVLPMLEGFAADLENILSEADIRPDEFQNIIEELGEGNEVTGGIAGLLSGIPGIEDDTVDNNAYFMAQNELSDWAKSGAVEYVQKFHDEKFKRHECETQIQNLQRELLELKQNNAVLEGNMKKKDLMLHKVTSAWNHVSKNWKAHETTSKSALVKLQEEQKNLLMTCQEDKERILAYEQQLVKTIEMADTFKTKIVEVEETKAAAIEKAKEDNSKLAQKIEKLSKSLQELSEEKNAALRALRESQLQMDQQNLLLDKVQKDLDSLLAKSEDDTKKFEVLNEEKCKFETSLKNLIMERSQQKDQIQVLTEKLKSVEISKENLKKNLKDEATRKMNEEGDRLHEYYNKKVQDVLKSATEKTLKAEATLVDSMKKANLETDRKLNDCRERHKVELTKLKEFYDSEIQSLKRDNFQKQLLISTTAQQLQTGELARSGAVDRLQSIVSSLPPTMSTEKKKQSPIAQYSKFTQNLNLNSFK